MPKLRSRNEIDKEVEKLDEEDLRVYNFAKQNMRLFYQAIDNANAQLDEKDKITTPLTSKDIENDDVLDSFILDGLVGEKGNKESIESAQKRKRVQAKAKLVSKNYAAKGDIHSAYKKRYNVESLVRRLPSYTFKLAKEDGSDSLECEKHNLIENLMYGDPDYKQVLLEEHFKKVINFDHSKTVDIIKSGDPEKYMDYALENPEIINSMFTTFAMFNDLDSTNTKKEVLDYQKNIMPVIDGVGGLFQNDSYMNDMYRLFDSSSLTAATGGVLMFACMSLGQEKKLAFIPNKDTPPLQRDSANFWRNLEWANCGARNDEREDNVKLAEYIADPLKYKAVQTVNDKEVEVSLLKVCEGKLDGKIVERTQEEKDILNGDFVIDAEKEHYKKIKQEVKEIREAMSKAKTSEEAQAVADKERERLTAHALERQKIAKAQDDKKFNEQFEKLTDRQKQLFGDAKIMYTILGGGVERYNEDNQNTTKLRPVEFDRWKILDQVRTANVDSVQKKAIEIVGQKKKSTELAEQYYKELGYGIERLGKDLGRSADGILLSENNSHGYDKVKRQNMADVALLSSSRSYVKPLQKIIQNRLMNVNIGEVLKYGVETDPIKKLNFYQQHEDDLKALFGSYKSINIDDGVKTSNKETENYLKNMRTFFEGVGGLFDPDAYKHDMLEFLPQGYSDGELVMISSYAALNEIKDLSKEERKARTDSLISLTSLKKGRGEYQNKAKNREQKLFGLTSLIDNKAVNAQGKEVPFDDYIMNVKGVKLAQRSEQEKAQIQKMFAPELEYEMGCRAREIEFTRKLFEKTPEKDLDNLMKTFARNKDAIFESAGLTEAENTGKKLNETVAKNQKLESLVAKKREYASHNFLWKIFMPKAYKTRSEISKAENEIKSSMSLADKLYLNSAEKNSFDKKGLNGVINDFKKNYATAEINAVDKTKLMSDYASIIKYANKFSKDFNKSGIKIDDITATAKTLVGKENETAINEMSNEKDYRNIDKKLAEAYDAVKERNNALIMQKLEEKTPNELANWVKPFLAEVNVDRGNIDKEKQEVKGVDVSSKQFYDDLIKKTKNADLHSVKEEKENTKLQVNEKDKKMQDKEV